MKKITYTRTEFDERDKTVENDLLAFVYDVPYFGACGIFPPFHIINQFFLSGGGMKPGATWEPFKITEEEYIELAEGLASAVPEDVKGRARYGDIAFEFDKEFDGIERWDEWIAVVCDKHRDNYRQKHKKK